MSSLFGSSYHEDWARERRQRQQDAAEAPRLRREVERLDRAIEEGLVYLEGALLGHEDGNKPVHEFSRGEVADLEAAVMVLREAKR